LSDIRLRPARDGGVTAAAAAAAARRNHAGRKEIRVHQRVRQRTRKRRIAAREPGRRDVPVHFRIRRRRTPGQNVRSDQRRYFGRTSGTRPRR